MLKAQIIGNLGKDAEMKTTQNGQQYFSFSVAHSFKTAQGQEQTVWVSCTKWVRQGESTAVVQYLKKGKKVYLEGTPSARAYAAQDGTPIGSLELNVQYIELLSPADQQGAPQQQAQQPAGNGWSINSGGVQTQPAPTAQPQQQAAPVQQQAAPVQQQAAPAQQWGAPQQQPAQGGWVAPNPNDPPF